MLPGLGRGPIPQSVSGLGWSGARRARSPIDVGQLSRPACSATTPGASQRWMWPLGSPDGPSSLLGLRACWSAGPRGAHLALGCTSPLLFPTLGGDLARPPGAPASGLRPSKERTSLGIPPRSPSWPLPLGLTWSRPKSRGACISR